LLFKLCYYYYRTKVVGVVYVVPPFEAPGKKGNGKPYLTLLQNRATIDIHNIFVVKLPLPNSAM
jgi:hypothetical protein